MSEERPPDENDPTHTFEDFEKEAAAIPPPPAPEGAGVAPAPAQQPPPPPDEEGWQGPKWKPRVIPGGVGGGSSHTPPDPVPSLAWMSPINYRPDKKPDPAYKKNYPPIRRPAYLFDLTVTPDKWPQTGYLRRYLDVVTPTTDAPTPFHLATALVTLAAALGPRWTVEHQSGGLFSNLWFFLIADSGSRKSTAMKMVTKLLTESRVWIGPVESTRAFMEAYKEQWEHNVLWWFDEATAFFNFMDKPYAQDLPMRLTTAYNGDPITYQSVATKGQLIVEKPFLSILMGAPLAWLRGQLKNNVIRGGIFGRFILVPAAKTDSKLMPPPLDPVATENLRRWLLMFAENEAHYKLTFSHAAEHTLLNWYAVTEKMDNEELALAGIWNRRTDLVLKLALLYHVSALRQPKQSIQQDSVEQAINFLHYYVFPGQLWALNRLVDVAPNVRAMLDIEERLESAPQGIRYGGVAREFGLQPDAAQKILYGLWTAKRLTFWRHHDPLTENGRPYYLITRHGHKPTIEGVPLAGYLHERPGPEDSRLPPALEKLREKIGDACVEDDISPRLKEILGENEREEELPEFDD